MSVNRCTAHYLLIPFADIMKNEDQEGVPMQRIKKNRLLQRRKGESSVNFIIIKQLFGSAKQRYALPVFFCMAILLFSVTSAHASRYVGPTGGGRGSQNGSDWNNCYNGLPASLVRGETYYIKEGSFGSYTFDDAHSGSTLIRIKKCGAAGQVSNGSGDGVCETAAGFIASEHDGQAIFSGMHFSTGYYKIDGVTGGGPGNWESGHGILLNGGVSSDKYVDNNSDYITMSHINVNVGATGPSDSRAFEIYGHDYFTVEYSYIHDIGMDIFSMNVMNNFTLQYSKIARNYQDAAYHGDIIEYQIGNATNFTVRYNFFQDVVGSYGFGSHGPVINGYYIYGNIFYFTKNSFFGNGLIGCLSAGGTLTNLKFYNNTIAGVMGDGGYGFGFGRMGGTGNAAYNNIYYRASGATAHSFSDVTHSNNTFYNMAYSGEQNLSGNPFVSFPSNLMLSGPTTAGSSFSSPYNSDMLGNTRGADGVLDRGAYEYGGSGQPLLKPIPPAIIGISP